MRQLISDRVEPYVLEAFEQLEAMSAEDWLALREELRSKQKETEEQATTKGRRQYQRKEKLTGRRIPIGGIARTQKNRERFNDARRVALLTVRR